MPSHSPGHITPPHLTHGLSLYVSRGLDPTHPGPTCVLCVHLSRLRAVANMSARVSGWSAPQDTSLQGPQGAGLWTIARV